MPCFQAQLRLSIFHIPNNRAHQHLYRPRFGYVALPIVKLLSNQSLSLTTNSLKLNSLRTVDIGIEERQSLIGGALAIVRNENSENATSIDLKEKKRREKIGLANKGHVPWNKGKQYDAETRERISQRTIEALKNPKVRQKMVECRRAYSHSEKAKKRIGSSLRRFWARRLKWKRSRENFYNSWAESIVEAAKMGPTEQELAERKVLRMAIMSTVRESDKERRKEKEEVRRKLRQERRKEKEEKDKLKRKMKLDKKDSLRRLKLKEKLNQIRQKVSSHGNLPHQKGVVTSNIQGLEKLDLDLMKSGCFKRQASLADQIRDAKNKKAELSTAEALTA